MFTPTPRVQVPSVAAKGEIFQVKALISHQMETGLRRDPQGDVIPRNIINKFSCRYNDIVVFGVDLHEAIAANPYIEFYLSATESGRLEFGRRFFSTSLQIVGPANLLRKICAPYKPPRTPSML